MINRKVDATRRAALDVAVQQLHQVRSQQLGHTQRQV